MSVLSYPSGPIRVTRHELSSRVRWNRWQWRPLLVACAIVGSLASLAAAAPAPAGAELPGYLKDRGRGIQTSLFGTYVNKGELLVYAFFEPTINKDQEYKPAELGFTVEQDFRAKYTEYEKLLFLSYGLSDRVAFEVESALHTSATQRKAADDPSNFPSKLKESGLGDTQAEIRWRWMAETERRPELFSYFETVFPLQKNRKLIGTSEWEFILGAGLIKGGRWGTFSARGSTLYTPDGSLETDEFAVEYLKRLSPSWRWDMAVEGEQDEWAAIGELQWFLRPKTFLKLNNAFGLTDKAPDFAPEVGILFSF